jgi:hypothetical protein
MKVLDIKLSLMIKDHYHQRILNPKTNIRPFYCNDSWYVPFDKNIPYEATDGNKSTLASFDSDEDFIGMHTMHSNEIFITIEGCNYRYPYFKGNAIKSHFVFNGIEPSRPLDDFIVICYGGIDYCCAVKHFVRQWVKRKGCY